MNGSLSSIQSLSPLAFYTHQLRAADGAVKLLLFQIIPNWRRDTAHERERGIWVSNVGVLGTHEFRGERMEACGYNVSRLPCPCPSHCYTK